MSRKFLSIVILWLIPILCLGQNDDEELLPPELAFAFSSEIIGNELIASWDIAEGHYMYQNKFAVVSRSDQVEVGELQLPPGVAKDDPLFGNVVVYTEPLEVRVPLTAKADVNNVELEVWGQGCNEPIGICFPPQMNVVSFTSGLISSAQAAEPQTDLKTSDSQNALTSLFSDLPSVTEDNLLEVDQAFIVNALVVDGERLNVLFEVAQGYYLYQDKLGFQSSDEVILMEPSLPTGEMMDDPFFGETRIYPANFEIEMPIIRSSPEAASFVFTAQYQGCAKDLICYPPVEKSFTLPLVSLIGSAHAATEDLGGGGGSDSVAPAQSTWIWLLISAFGAGILFTLTPSVLPLIPILLAVIAGTSGNSPSMKNHRTFSIAFVMGAVVAYAFVGGVAGATGDQLLAYFQNTLAFGFLSLVLVLMAVSLFGLYEKKLPLTAQTKWQEGALRFGKVSAVFALGIISTLIVGACVPAALIPVLGVVISRADIVLGTAVMISMALGIGLVLIAIGIGMGWILVKAEAWIDQLKQAFGVVLLGVSVYLLGYIPQIPILLLWAVLLIVSGVYLGATQQVEENAGGWRYLWKGAGMVALVWGIFALVGSLMGNRDILRPLSYLSGVG